MTRQPSDYLRKVERKILAALHIIYLLVQCQACVLSLLSSVFAIVMGLASDDAFRIDQALFVASSSMATAAVASFLL
ncbi:hypothetical protein MTO96_042423, partial [Rhipicephalus appendiculatus]